MNRPFQGCIADGYLTPWARWLLAWSSIGIAYARSLGCRVTVLHDEIIVERPRPMRELRWPNIQNIPRRKS